MRPKRGRPVGPGGRRGSDLKLRLEPALLGAIKKAAKKNGRTWSEEARQWLMNNLRRKHKAQRWPDTYALTEQLADFIEGVEDATGKEWRRDTWTHKAILAGIEYLVSRGAELGALEVPEKIEQVAAELTEKLAEQHRDPVSFGTNAAIVTSRILDNQPDQPPSDAWLKLHELRHDLRSPRTKRRQR
jgi:hypothetical protein